MRTGSGDPGDNGKPCEESFTDERCFLRCCGRWRTGRGRRALCRTPDLAGMDVEQGDHDKCPTEHLSPESGCRHWILSLSNCRISVPSRVFEIIEPGAAPEASPPSTSATVLAPGKSDFSFKLDTRPNLQPPPLADASSGPIDPEPPVSQLCYHGLCQECTIE